MVPWIMLVAGVVFSIVALCFLGAGNKDKAKRFGVLGCVTIVMGIVGLIVYGAVLSRW